ncbi:MAG TPA: inositol monophosphatase family protein [Nitrospiraceae bacterium]|jgi:myo-inositol-1(or 4)-monophosphatase|nr:inositol monophosphatase family protein [Nitrospiraceae bacterium]
MNDVLPPLFGSRHERFKTVAVDAARKAGAILQQYARSGFQIEYKSVVNLVTDADHQAEQAIIDCILAAYPSHGIFAEERGRQLGTDSAFQWIIDPLDGTTNFAHGYPAYCVSIGLEYEGQGLLGVVYDPTRDELFTAVVGQGAYLNGTRLHVSDVQRLDQALLVTGFAYDIRDTPANNLDHFARFALRAQGLRRTGTAALDLCYVAAGRFDGFWELKLQPWDMAAGVVILREAGGRVSNFKGGPLSIYDQGLVASNGLIHEAMLAVLALG